MAEKPFPKTFVEIEDLSNNNEYCTFDIVDSDYNINEKDIEEEDIEEEDIEEEDSEIDLDEI